MKRNEQTENGVKTRKKAWLYGTLGASVLLLAAVIVFIVLAINGTFGGPVLDNPIESGASGTPSGGGSGSSDNPNDPGKVNPDKPAGTTDSYVNPLETMTVLTQHGFFYNSTLNCYYEHIGIDIGAEAGTDVYAVCDATVEAVYSGDVLNGTQIILNKGDGVKAIYNYVTPVDGLKAGDKVKQGQIIAKVAEPTGDEYKSGAHLHLEMYVGGESADPAKYLTFSEK